MHIIRFKDFSLNENQNIDNLIKNWLTTFENISTFEELYTQIGNLTLGFLSPLNPQEPLRSILKEKISTLLQTETVTENIKLLEKYQDMLNTVWEPKDLQIPPGAMV
jgi:hypothetical protein